MPTIHDEHWHEDFRYRQDLRELENSCKPKDPLEVLDAPNARIEREAFFPWHCEFKNESSFLETVLGKDALNVSSESEDAKRVEQNEESLFLSEVKKLSVRKTKK